MKTIFTFLIILMTTLTSADAQNSDQTPGKLLRHVVLLKFKTTSSSAEVKKVEDAFRAVPSKIKTVRGFEWGKNNSPENLNQEFTHCFFVTFDSEKDRDAYLPHPDHKAFVDVLLPHLDKVLVIDYWADK